MGRFRKTMRAPNRAANQRSRRGERSAAEAHAARPVLLAGADLPSPPRQRRSVENRARLKAAALLLFSHNGYAGTSIDKIAAQADLAVGGFYLHFRTKRQLLMALMDDLLRALSAIELELTSTADPETGIRSVLSRAFSTDLRFLGAYRAWQEAILTDAELARKQNEIHAWTTMRVLRVFRMLQTWPGARPGIDLEALARVVDRFFWSLLAEALRLRDTELDEWLDASTHLIVHALFVDRHKE
jgi:AcrR family transcriptional regulator